MERNTYTNVKRNEHRVQEEVTRVVERHKNKNSKVKEKAEKSRC